MMHNILLLYFVDTFLTWQCIFIAKFDTNHSFKEKMIGKIWGSKRGRFPILGGRWMFRREMGSKRGSLPPKEGDLTCMSMYPFISPFQPVLLKPKNTTVFLLTLPYSWTFVIKTTYKYTKDKNLVWNQYTLFDLSRFIHSDCGSSPVKTMLCQQANIVGRKIVAHRGLEPATFGFQV